MAGHRKWSELRAKMRPERQAASDAAAAEMLRHLPLRYAAIITTEGPYTLAEFPDCPGCQTFAEPGENILARAQEAIEGWLETLMDHGEEIPVPSTNVVPPEGGRVELIPVSPKSGQQPSK